MLAKDHDNLLLDLGVFLIHVSDLETEPETKEVANELLDRVLEARRDLKQST